MTFAPRDHSSQIASVEDSVESSTEIWARDLQSLFQHAKDRFADVSWETEDGGDRIWGHKGAFSVSACDARLKVETMSGKEGERAVC